MSVQLIVYPQSYEGIFNAFSGNPTEALVNGINFSGLDNTGTYTTTSATPYVDVLTNAPPSIVNTWYRFRKNMAGTPAFPTVSAGNLILESGGISITGVYQQLSNLTAGQLYIVTINVSIPVASGGTVTVGAFDGTVAQGSSTYNANLTQITKMFLAVAPQMNLMISYSHPAALNLEISSISALPLGTQTADPIISDGQVILDLYEDEDLPLTLSVDNFKNAAEKVQSYSKAFNLPATKRNNKIFDQIFEITRSDDGVIFSPYKKTECVLKQDGFILFKGYLRLLDVTDKDAEISYNVNLYSEVIALADYLKELSFIDLDFTELEHDYNKTQIKYSWNDGVTSGQTTPITWTNANTSGFRTNFETLKYPFVNWNNNWLIANGSTGSSATLNRPELTSLEQAFRPFINIKYIIERIFENSPFTFTSDFFNTTDFKKLYMDFNWGSDNAPVVFNSSGQLTRITDQSLTTSYTTLDFQNMLGTIISPNFGYSSGVFTAQEDGQVYNISFNMEFKTSALVIETLDVEWVINGVANVSLNQTVTSNGHTWIGNFTTIALSAGDTVLCRAKSSGVTMDLESGGFPATTALVTATTSSDQTTSDTLLGTLRGETGQWEFLKGLMTMFNLVTIPDENNPNNIKFEPYVDVFINNTAGTTLANRTIEHDWTDKIDVSEMKLEPLTDLNRRTIFKFVEDEDDFAFTNYKNQVGGHLYGSKKFNATDEFNILDGLDEIIAEPFAATLVKPLASQYSSFITPALYAYNSEDDTSEGFDNSPRIMYNNGIKTTGTSYFIPAQNGVAETIAEADFLQFSHIKEGGLVISDYADFHFGECQLLTNQASTLNNLFNLYWLPYYNELYNPNTRTMTIKVNLSPSDINLFKFNDTVFIKNRVFRVNKIDYKPNDLATVEFILIP